MTPAAEAVAVLVGRGWTLGVAESLTGGAVAAEVVSVPGASAALWGGVIAYATPVKHSVLGVDEDLLAKHGPVHPEVALQMAEGVRRAVAVGRPSDVGIATTGIAGPDSPDGQPVGTVHVAVVTPDGSLSESFRFSGDRADIRAQSVDAVLDALCRLVRE
ncbi:CinA family protein [Microbacterium sp. GCS4]|uniref:CinA family protein n=1 Tax=Microbacterium sp. GCS4 TaxID=1692239 RepID=UPI000680C265|nr:nicotinamide-nucleotide amidohydrolase family protein [Microbacterium sp. GCS4]KNY07257.1 damage-inducible protein CinA [Microbacterium sp. GCS4]